MNFLFFLGQVSFEWKLPEDFWLVAIPLGAALLMGAAGAGIGEQRGRPAFGFFMGFLLGPIGWLIICLLPRHGRKCPLCLGIIPDGAIRCMHCAADLQRAGNRFK